MSESRKRPSTRRSTLKLIGASLMAAAAITGGLAVQMAHGHDPALGAGQASAQTSAQTGADTQAAPATQSAPDTVVTRAS
ncbi:MAG TPA: hypothetical protein VGO83_05560 [Thermoleophilaceae bacterium]|jgi:hypothetical protein|nr:hypothetical protein [Thermoleophilaceae bacterium]